MEHWPGHERRERQQTPEERKDRGKQNEHRVEPNLWRWPHLEHGSIGRTTLVFTDGRVKWTSVVNTLYETRWSPSSNPVKVFPETRPPQVNIHEHSTRQRTEKGIQYLHSYFPDTDFPRELLEDTLEEDAIERYHLNDFDPLLGNLLEVIPCHRIQDESVVVFPMGELGRELNISRFTLDGSGNMVFHPAGSPSFAFETPILHISSAVKPSDWVATPFSPILIRTHSSSSLLRLECSKVTKVLDITRSETGGVPIMDSRILAYGPDIVVVNRSGKVYKCDTCHNSKATQSVGAPESENDDPFWQLGITRRNDEYFLASCNAVRHIDLRSGSVSNVFSLDHPSTTVTSFESPLHDYISRITTTADVIWLDDRFRKRPLLSYKHNRSFDRTLRVLTANLSGVSLSLLTSRRNGLVTLYDVGRGSDRLLHCNSVPSCLPHREPIFTAYDGHALAVLPSHMELTLLRLCQRGSIYRQEIALAQLDEDRPGPVQEGRVTHQWGEDVQALDKAVDQLHTDFGPTGGRHYTEVNLRSAYEKMFAIADDTRVFINQNEPQDMMARLLDTWQDAEEVPESMLTMFDVMSGKADGNRHTPRTDFLADTTIYPKQLFDALTRGQVATEELAGSAQWHYAIQNTLVPALSYPSINCSALNEYLKKLDLVSEMDRHDSSMRRETEAREQLVVDLVLSNGVYSARQISKHHSFAADWTTTNTVARPTEISYSEEPPEVNLGYFRPIRKAGISHYAEKNQDDEHDPGVSGPLGVRLLLAEWELGMDPKDYMYRDPYGLADLDERPVPQYRQPLATPPMTQKKQMPPQQPPVVVAVATQPPIVERVAPTIGSQPVQRTGWQQFEMGLEASSQELMMSTQVLPGPFGGRPAAGKKPVKKRIGGF